MSVERASAGKSSLFPVAFVSERQVPQSLLQNEKKRINFVPMMGTAVTHSTFVHVLVPVERNENCG